MQVEIELLTNKQIYRRIMCEEIQAVQRSLLVGTALLKETRIETTQGIVSFNEYLDRLVRRNVEVGVLFAGKPSKPFVDALCSFPNVLSDVSWRSCPRTHLKAVLVDGERLYLGSANLTGAGLGMKSENKRNFEVGLFTTDQRLISTVRQLMTDIMDGTYCESCQVRALCQKEHEHFQAAIAACGTPTPN